MARKSVTDIDNYRRQKKRAGNFRWILIALFFLACACSGYFFALSPFFYVDTVAVSGNLQVSEERLRQLSGVEMGQNIFTVSDIRVRDFIRLEPFVDSVKVERRLPRTIAIEITEREPVAVLPTGQSFLQIDLQGLVLRRLDELASVELPIVTGVTDFPADMMPGSSITGEQIAVALAVLAALPQDAHLAVTEIDVTDSQKIKLYSTGSIELRMGNATNLAEKYVIAIGIAENLHHSGQAANTRYIDVSSTAKPVIMPYE